MDTALAFTIGITCDYYVIVLTAGQLKNKLAKNRQDMQVFWLISTKTLQRCFS
jgi:hypothetical protein